MLAATGAAAAAAATGICGASTATALGSLFSFSTTLATLELGDVVSTTTVLLGSVGASDMSLVGGGLVAEGAAAAAAFAWWDGVLLAADADVDLPKRDRRACSGE